MNGWGNVQLNKLKTVLSVWLTLLSVAISGPMQAWAQTSSPNYRVEESFFGTGGELDASSQNYRARQSAGELTVGNTGSSNFQAQTGFNTTDEPYLEFSVTEANVDIGYLSASSTGIANATLTAKSYLSHGYIITAVGNLPSSGSSQLAGLNTPTASNAGTEQFGMNLRANTIPTPFGADPVQSPDGTFGFGQITTDYDTPNMYKFVRGDIIAYSNTSTGQTTFMVSYIFNQSPLTTSGSYITNQIFVMTATF